MLGGSTLDADQGLGSSLCGFLSVFLAPPYSMMSGFKMECLRLKHTEAADLFGLSL
jgi:hypothetical protein